MDWVRISVIWPQWIVEAKSMFQQENLTCQLFCYTVIRWWWVYSSYPTRYSLKPPKYDGTIPFETFWAQLQNCSEYTIRTKIEQLAYLRASLQNEAGLVLWVPKWRFRRRSWRRCWNIDSAEGIVLTNTVSKFVTDEGRLVSLYRVCIRHPNACRFGLSRIRNNCVRLLHRCIGRSRFRIEGTRTIAS